ncbi:hypothetical protein ACGFYM_44275 [Streptomyces sp. NPDC048231]|uniref:hypothetical protein n=1 Tax=Streptomyces sp. NPDC048231 TaxID=3365519 RepID=UPI0037167032
MNDLHTEEDVRGFLRLCLDPGRGVERAPLQLMKVMPQALRDAAEQYVPQLAELREATLTATTATTTISVHMRKAVKVASE